MHAPKLSLMTAGAVLALSVTLASGAQPAAAQSGAAQGAAAEPSAAVDSSAPDAAEVEARVPLPEFIDLPPLTPADVGDVPKREPAAGSAAAAPPASAAAGAPAAQAAPPKEGAPGAAAASPRGLSDVSSKAPTEPPVQAAMPATAPSAAEIQRAVPAPEPAVVAPPTKDLGAPALHPADLAIAERLKALIAERLDRFVDRKRDRAAVEEFYEARNFAPLWFDHGAPNERMRAAVQRLKAAAADGLDPADYPTPDPMALADDPEARAQAELKLTSSVLTYARHAQSGRVVPSRISTNIDFAPPVPEPADVLKEVAAAQDVAKTLDGFNPTHDGFLALKRKLAELRGAGADHTVQIPAGPILRPGGSDKRVPLLRKRLGVAGGETSLEYDDALAEAVKEFQKRKGLTPDGVIGQRTIEALNGRNHSREIETIISNMERWRWLPRDLGNAYVMVNVPDFTLKVVRDHKTVFHTRIVVGKPSTPTPSFAAAIENILVNPTWHVPQSIIYNEYLPALREDPTVLARMGLVMERNRDGTISIRQPPGERNALGRLKFNFPNRFQVYLHDTPDKNLFNHERRAYSHGCMRVQNPTQFGEVLTSIAMPENKYTAERLRSMFGTGERWLKFSKPIPVYLVYLNAYVDDAGKLVVREDLYGYDQRVQSALRGEYLSVSERSQRVSPTAMRRARQIVQEVPRQPRGFFLFPWFQ